MAPLMGARIWQRFTPTYGDDVRPLRGQQRAHEQRQFARELQSGGELPGPLDDPTACVHGCNGECLTDGSPWCSFACHLDGISTEAEWRRARVELAAEIWPGGSLTRTRREQVYALLEHHRQVRAARES